MGLEDELRQREQFERSFQDRGRLQRAEWVREAQALVAEFIGVCKSRKIAKSGFYDTKPDINEVGRRVFVNRVVGEGWAITATTRDTEHHQTILIYEDGTLRQTVSPMEYQPNFSLWRRRFTPPPNSYSAGKTLSYEEAVGRYGVDNLKRGLLDSLQKNSR